ncbi:MAG: AAA family ATPase [Blastocatellales bacterium]|nr:AAA family ATPase [Blastocatellales bacterium]
MSQTIIYKLDHLLNEILFQELAQWLRPKLEIIYGSAAWWDQGVYQKLSEAQRARRRDRSSGDLTELDLQGLLHICSKNFEGLVDKCGVTWDLRTPLESVRGARNALSHRKGGQSPDPDDLLLHALNTKKLLSLMAAPRSSIEAADRVVKAITDPEREATGGARLGEQIGGDLDRPLQDQRATPKADAVTKPKGIDPPPINEPKPVAAVTKPKNVEETPPPHRQPAGADIDPTRTPLEGMNPVVTAQLKTCTQGEGGAWLMGLIVGEDGQQRHVQLSVPRYFSDSAQAASQILDSVASREKPPSIHVKLLNVRCKGGNLFFPADPAENGEAYPLLVIQPSYLINVTSLTHFDFCSRNYLMDRYSIPESNQAMKRGALVHSVFDFMLRHPGDHEGLIHHCHTELDGQLPDLTMQGIPPAQHYEDVRPHLDALTQGIDGAMNPASFADVYAERYMINPDLGLKGKIDALVRKTNGRWQALELKTGKSWGATANAGHAFQVCAYHLLLSQAGIGPLDPPSVIYTGNQAKLIKEGNGLLPPSTMCKTLAFDARTAIKIINLRNELVRIDYTSELAFNDNANKCEACKRQCKAEHCVNLHGMGLDGGESFAKCLEPLVARWNVADKCRDGFQAMNGSLLAEFQAIRTEHGQVLQGSIESRIAKGICLRVKQADMQTEDGYITLELPDGNGSEFREGDPCLVSDSVGPVKGNCIEVYISQVNKTRAVVSLPQGVNRLWFEPAYLDVNAPDTAFERNFAGLYTLWKPADGEDDTLGPIRRFLNGEAHAFRPNEELVGAFHGVQPPPLPAQRRAVGLALGLKDMLLIQGPPGTGKTYTLALVVKALAQQGQHVAIATYTHRAADEVMSKLAAAAPELKIRKLGRPEAVAAQHSDKCMNDMLARKDDIPHCSEEQMLVDLEARRTALRKFLRSPAVYIGTTHAWLSGAYDALPRMMSDGQRALFDVVVVDEASQIITPNLVGVLRLAKRWVLVGDHKQLPPIVVGDTTGNLAATLFEAIAEHPERDTSLIVQLDTQHRMPTTLSDFIGNTFYGGRLKTAATAVKRSHLVACAHPLIATSRCISLVNVAQSSEAIHLKQFIDEAKWITDTIAELAKHDWPLRDNAEKPTIGIIAPYRAQVALLRRCLERRFDGKVEHEFWNDVVDTVDRFQGDERDVIMLSLCLRQGSERIPRVYEDERRINVALSRAKMKLWVVGSIADMERIPVLKAFRHHTITHPEVCTVL